MTIAPLHATVPTQPGTRYRVVDPRTPLPSTELAVERTVRDDLGMLHVVLTDLGGREISLFVEQFEAAIVSGMLAPIPKTSPTFA
ncbi:MAG TPA: hypothetical protein VGR22_02785 [Thermomicrobiales bacterium]|nr:hypothetical protein [Thermomicrobiales bacterium]